MSIDLRKRNLQAECITPSCTLLYWCEKAKGSIPSLRNFGSHTYGARLAFMIFRSGYSSSAMHRRGGACFSSALFSRYHSFPAKSADDSK